MKYTASARRPLLTPVARRRGSKLTHRYVMQDLSSITIDRKSYRPYVLYHNISVPMVTGTLPGSMQSAL